MCAILIRIASALPQYAIIILSGSGALSCIPSSCPLSVYFSIWLLFCVCVCRRHLSLVVYLCIRYWFCSDYYALPAAFCIGCEGGWEGRDNASFPLRRSGVIVICSCRQLTGEKKSVIWPLIAVVTCSESISFVATRGDLLSAVEKLRSTQRFLNCCSCLHL